MRNRITFSRLTLNLWFLLLAWPLLTIVGATLEARRLPYYELSWLQAVGAALAGTLLLAPDFLVVGAIFTATSLAIFGRFTQARSSVFARATERPHRAEPFLLFLSMNAGIALWYPGVLGQSLVALPDWPAWYTVAALTALVTAASFVVAPGRGIGLAAALLIAGVMMPTPAIVRSRLLPSSADSPAIVILGLDSVSMEDDVEQLRQWTQASNGAWYEKAVTPGLLTNAVWASILTEQPVSQHGIFHPNQHLAAERATLLRRADARGLATVSFFFDQLTCTVGSEAGFTVDRSSPMGWRQLLIPVVANSSILIPAIKPIFPNGWSALGANEVGLYSYSLDRSFMEALTAKEGAAPTVVMAHTTYLHAPSYPMTLQLSIDELKRVWAAPALSLRDRTFDWQDRDRHDDPVPLRQWKLRYLQESLARSVQQSQLLDRGGKLVIFSDHGLRLSVTEDNFTESRFHHVVLATFGMDVRPVGEPISLIDIGALTALGQSDGARAEPVVEFAVSPPAYWAHIVESARFRWDGAVDLDESFLTRIFAGLKSYRPWTADPVALERAAPGRSQETK